MKTVQNVAELQRLALATGAEIVSPGARFNSERRQVDAAPPPRAAAAPAQQATFTRAEVEALLAAHSAKMHEHIARLLAARNKAETPSPHPTDWDFDISYRPDGSIANVRVKALP